MSWPHSARFPRVLQLRVMCCVLNRLIAPAEAAALPPLLLNPDTHKWHKLQTNKSQEEPSDRENCVCIYCTIAPIPYYLWWPQPRARGRQEHLLLPTPHPRLACIWQRTHVLQPHKCASINYLHWKHIANKMQMARKCLFSEVCLESSSTQIINT